MKASNPSALIRMGVVSMSTSSAARTPAQSGSAIDDRYVSVQQSDGQWMLFALNGLRHRSPLKIDISSRTAFYNTGCIALKSMSEIASGSLAFDPVAGQASPIRPAPAKIGPLRGEDARDAPSARVFHRTPVWLLIKL
jgi:hypothetical protein